MSISFGIRVRSGSYSFLISRPLLLSPVSPAIAIVGSVVSAPIAIMSVSLSVRVRSGGLSRCVLAKGKAKESQCHQCLHFETNYLLYVSSHPLELEL